MVHRRKRGIISSRNMSETWKQLRWTLKDDRKVESRRDPKHAQKCLVPSGPGAHIRENWKMTEAYWEYLV